MPLPPRDDELDGIWDYQVGTSVGRDDVLHTVRASYALSCNGRNLGLPTTTTSGAPSCSARRRTSRAPGRPPTCSRSRALDRACGVCVCDVCVVASQLGEGACASGIGTARVCHSSVGGPPARGRGRDRACRRVTAVGRLTSLRAPLRTFRRARGSEEGASSTTSGWRVDRRSTTMRSRH